MEELEINDFKEFLATTEEQYEDGNLIMFLRTSINSLWIMHEQGNKMATKTLIELKNYI